MTAKPRPGGRSARNKAAVFEATAALLAERGHEAVTMTDIAARADTLVAVTLRQTTFADAVKAGLVKIDGDPRKPDELMSMLDTFNVMFEVVEPKPSGQ